MAFGGLFGGSSSSTPVTSTTVGSSSQVKDQLKAQIGQELAVANATELVNKMTENCFELCQKAPYGTSDDVSDFVEWFRKDSEVILTLVTGLYWQMSWEVHEILEHYFQNLYC